MQETTEARSEQHCVPGTTFPQCKNKGNCKLSQINILIPSTGWRMKTAKQSARARVCFAPPANKETWHAHTTCMHLRMPRRFYRSLLWGDGAGLFSLGAASFSPAVCPCVMMPWTPPALSLPVAFAFFFRAFILLFFRAVPRAGTVLSPAFESSTSRGGGVSSTVAVGGGVDVSATSKGSC